MGVVQDQYDKMAIGDETTARAMPASPDACTLTVEDFERFEHEFRALEAMARDSLVDITYRHFHRSSGRTFADLVKFRKLA